MQPQIAIVLDCLIILVRMKAPSPDPQPHLDDKLTGRFGFGSKVEPRTKVSILNILGLTEAVDPIFLVF